MDSVRDLLYLAPASGRRSMSNVEMQPFIFMLIFTSMPKETVPSERA
jgi:hypothetical protein